MGKIQDVTSQVQGVIPTLFRYGYVYVQTAGEKERFVFKKYDSLSNSYIEEAESEAIKEYFKLTGKKIRLNEDLLLKEDDIKSKQKDVKDRLCAPVTITSDYPALDRKSVV